MFEEGRGSHVGEQFFGGSERLISSRYGAPFAFSGTLPYRRRMSSEFLPYLPAAKRVSQLLKKESAD